MVDVMTKKCLVLKPLGYCSVQKTGTSKILAAFNIRFELTTMPSKYLIVGRNFSCMSHRSKADCFGRILPNLAKLDVS